MWKEKTADYTMETCGRISISHVKWVVTRLDQLDNI